MFDDIVEGKIDSGIETRKMIAQILIRADKEYGPETGLTKYIETADKIADLIRFRFDELYPDLMERVSAIAQKQINERMKKYSFMYIGD